MGLLYSSVYFMTDGEAIKIGISGAPELRRKALQGGHPRPLKLLGTMEGGEKEENALHRRFAHLHIRGEWFRPEPELMSFIEETCGLPPQAPKLALMRIRKIPGDNVRSGHLGIHDPKPETKLRHALMSWQGTQDHRSPTWRPTYKLIRELERRYPNHARLAKLSGELEAARGCQS